jgi:hypothetical protein
MSVIFTDEIILKPIGTKKSGYTIPEVWRKKLNIDQQYVRAKLQDNRIVIEAMHPVVLDWDTKIIQLNELNDETIEMVEQSHKNYQAGNKEAFVTLEDFKNEL